MGLICPLEFLILAWHSLVSCQVVRFFRFYKCKEVPVQGFCSLGLGRSEFVFGSEQDNVE